MLSRHGTLEGAILTTLWNLEERGSKLNTVKDVFENIESDKRAYTTIKTVMDRLAEKNMLKRYKNGKKFCYKATETRSKMANTAINKLLKQYFNNDASLLLKTIEKECIK